jgi:hypothetical protein
VRIGFERCARALRDEIADVSLSGLYPVAEITQSGLWRLVGHVAKKQLVSVIQVLLGNRPPHVAPQEKAATLMRELATFKANVTEAGNETFESWRERDHDDLVLAVALACWGAETIAWPPPTTRPGPRLVRV